MLHINHFSKQYAPGRYAVQDLTLHVAPGEIYGFLGHNGAGKSTTLRAVAGILDFTEGEIAIDGHSVRTEPVSAKRAMAFLPDNPDLYDFLTGIQYLNFIGDICEIPATARTERITRYAGDFALTADLGSPIGSYSHGMKQKLALISALIREPKLLLWLTHGFTPLQGLAFLLVSAALSAVVSLGGTAVNLRFPRLDAANDTVVCKQSLSAMLGIFGGMALALAGIAGCLLVGARLPLAVYLLACGVLLTLLAAALGIWLDRAGPRYLQKL